ncbi:unnamed protein product [Fraxinus pennsylvanica]|uniref:Uncharacterized protein n=1 Tax=Fraxinus pennsylvanica TaxID=56036 RepID=A0AAD2DT46_9LAMI|nr:unnamed protein product [Fraxinus pennsylvanica]
MERRGHDLEYQNSSWYNRAMKVGTPVTPEFLSMPNGIAELKRRFGNSGAPLQFSFMRYLSSLSINPISSSQEASFYDTDMDEGRHNNFWGKASDSSDGFIENNESIDLNASLNEEDEMNLNALSSGKDTTTGQSKLC